MRPAMRPKRRSSGVATAEAIVSGLAPGKAADTEMVGKSTRGSGAMGSSTKAAIPASNSAAASSEVATGRRMNGPEMFIRVAPARRDGDRDRAAEPPPGRSAWRHRVRHAARARRDVRPNRAATRAASRPMNR